MFLTAEEVAHLTGTTRKSAQVEWLREQNWFDGKLCCVMNPGGSIHIGAYCPSGDYLDAEIDAALLAAPVPAQPSVPVELKLHEVGG